MMVMKINLGVRQWILAVLFLLLATYILFQARFIIFGPEIVIENPRDGERLASTLVLMKGRTENIAGISLNDRQIFTDEKGFWEEKLLVSPGASIMTVRVHDRFGRKREKSVRVIYNP